MSEGNFKAGEVALDSVTLVNQEGEVIDLTNLAVSIDIFEGIDNPFLSGRISILDGMGIFRKYKIFGQEHITIRYRTKQGVGEFTEGDFAVEKAFRVYKITDMLNHDSRYTYVLHICEPKLFTVTQTRLSKVLRGSYSEILLQTLLKDAQFEELPENNSIEFWEESLPENQQIVCPNWTIRRLIDYIKDSANLGENAVYKNSMFFYQSLVGGFRFMSLNKMISGDMDFVLPFSSEPRNQKIESENVDVDDPTDGINTQILNFEIQKKGDTLHGMTTGAYASRLKTYDPIRKLEKDVVFDLGENYDKKGKNHMSGFPTVRLNDDIIVHQAEESLTAEEDITYSEIGAEQPMNKIFDAKHIYRVNHTNAFSDSAILNDTSQFIGNEYLDSGLLERNSMLHHLSSHVYKVTIPIRSDLSAGMVVTLRLPGGAIEQNEVDELDDQRFLITKIHHIVSPLSGDGTMVLQCVKESFAGLIKEQEALKDYEGPTGPND